MGSSLPEPVVSLDASASGVQLTVSLWQAMREHGVRLSPDQLACGLSLTHLAGDDHQMLSQMLVGVFAKNSVDAALFHRLVQEQAPPPTSVIADATAPSDPRRDARHEPLAWVASGEVFLACAGSAWLATRPQASIELPPPPPPFGSGGEASNTLKPQSLSLRLSQEPYTSTYASLPAWWPLVEGAMVLFPVVLALAFAAWLRSRAPAWTKLPADEQERLLEVALVATKSDNLFAGSALRRLARSLRRARPAFNGTIDIERTVRATVQAAGRITLVRAAPAAWRPLHLAMERKSRDDHLVQLFNRAACRLRDLGAPVRLFSYRQDVRLLRDEDGRARSAVETAHQDEDAVLAIVGDGEGLRSPHGNKIGRSRSAFEAWPVRYLLSTRRQSTWGHRENRLVAQGLGVAPANLTGLSALAEQLELETPRAGLIREKR